MAMKEVNVERFSITSPKPFGEVVKALEASVGSPNMSTFMSDISSAKSFSDLEKIVYAATGASGLMRFMRFDLGEIVRKERGDSAPRSLRYLIGNPLIMKQMLERSPDAGSYAPVTILLDERPDGVWLSYDRMASFLAPYGSSEALKVARELDAKIETLLTKAAA
ncbi:MAG: DUF302 domain-containing protein [Candidatus Acidiferrales bacterium]